MFRGVAFSLLVLAIVAPAIAADQAPKTLRVYFVGNSVTDTIKYGALADLAKSRGCTQVWGRHMIPGAPLQWIWQHPKDGFQEPPFGHYPTALANFSWDVLSLQPFDRHLDGKDGDIAMAKNFIDLALPKSPDLQVDIYARWPRQGKDDFDTTWLKKYTGGWDNTNETKDYFERLTLELRKAYPKLKKPILMVPVGHVMYELNQRMKAGQVPGYTHIKQLFADSIHLNIVGSYVVACTFFATLYKQNPSGLPSKPYMIEDLTLAAIIQDVVWKVVSTHELAGVKKAGEDEALSDQDKRIAVEIGRLGSKSESAAGVKALIKIGKPAAPALINVLSDPRNDVRAFAAESLRRILAADPSNAPNCHDKEFWKQRITRLKARMPLDEALKVLLPEISPAERRTRYEGCFWFEGIGNSVYRLDDYWTIHVYLIDFRHEKLHDDLRHLRQSVREVFVSPPANYTGEWVTWYVNGQKANQIQYRNGQFDGTYTAFHDNGSKKFQRNYKSDVPYGTEMGWRRNGEQEYESQYEHGEQVGTRIWRFENDQIESPDK